LATWSFGELFDHKADGIVGLSDDQRLQQVLEEVVDAIVAEILLHLLLVLQLGLLVHAS